MKILILLFWLLLLPTKEQSTVFICKGKSSERYHLNKSCRGLSNCSTDTYAVSISEARKRGRTLCKWED